jgi:chromosomal replication initiation ATPase DnaA
MTNEQRIEPMLDYFGVSINEVKQQTRVKHIKIARFYCMEILRRTTEMSLQSIGQYFGGRDHTTVINARQAFDSFENDYSHQYHQNRFASIVGEIRAYVDPMPDLIGMNEMYLSVTDLE